MRELGGEQKGDKPKERKGKDGRIGWDFYILVLKLTSNFNICILAYDVAFYIFQFSIIKVSCNAPKSIDESL